MMTTGEMEQIQNLCEAIGGIGAYADPDGPIATRYALTPEQRLAEIWEIVRPLIPSPITFGP